ncbi:MAG: zinc ABC transporter substrate-binding protein [Elusimicrobiaceae bacterium]|nr:zinc ABC transporter substrate-binding protein [Elusimicrobiaceae bacterium]
MKKINRWVLIILGVLIGLFLCVLLFSSYHSQRSNHSPAQEKLVVSGYVPHIVVRELLGPSAPILQLLPAGTEPHSFEPTPGALVQLKNASIFVYVSDELEPWAAELAEVAGPKTQILKLATLVPPSQDPHIWMDLGKMQIIFTQTASFLCKIFPQDCETIDRNREEAIEQLYQLEQEFSSTLSNCKYRKVIHVGHLAFKNLLTPYGIELMSLSGTSHEGEHSVKKLTQLIQSVQINHIPAVFTEEMLSARLAQAVATETGVEILKLYPIESVSKQDFDHQVSYIELMHRNLESLKRGLQCPAS